MNYRLIVRYEETEIVTIQQFADLDTIDTIIHYLDNATENGAKLAFEVQHRLVSGKIATIDSYGKVGRWNETNWD